MQNEDIFNKTLLYWLPIDFSETAEYRRENHFSRYARPRRFRFDETSERFFFIHQIK